MSEDDRPAFCDAVEDVLPRDTLKATLKSLVNAIYDVIERWRRLTIFGLVRPSSSKR